MSRWKAVALMAMGLKVPGRVLDLVEEDADGEGAEDADEHGGFDLVGLQDGDEDDAEDGELGAVLVEVAEGDGGGGALDDDAGVDQADEGDEEADASGDGGVELVGDGGDEFLADASEGEQEEDDAGEEDGAEGGLPGDVHALDDGVGEVGVEAHAGGEGEGVVGEGSHHDGAEGGAEAGGSGDGGEGHAGLGEDGGVHEDDVGHRDEGGEAGEELDAPGGLVLVKLEVGFCGLNKPGARSHAARTFRDAGFWVVRTGYLSGGTCPMIVAWRHRGS